MSRGSVYLSMGFAYVGHTFSHLFPPIFYVVVLTLEDDWALSHGEAIALIVTGNILYGVLSPLAGWLSDRWSLVGMVGVYFFGLGAAMVATGFAEGPASIAIWLAVCGVFGAIYHPVGIAWLVRIAVNRGTALGVVGLFGGFGPAIAAPVAGLLVAAVSWRAAFIVPGVVVLLTGAVFALLVWRGAIADSDEDRAPQEAAPRKEIVRAFIVLAFTMLCTGLIYNATQPALPKFFSERAGDLGGGIIGITLMVSAVYAVAGILQVAAGYLADRFPLRRVYLFTFVAQVPILVLAANLNDTALFAVAILMVTLNVGSLPAENALVARYAPKDWRGLVFGLKFVIGFGFAGVGTLLEGALYDLTGGFYWLFVVLAAVAAVAAVSSLLLPGQSEPEAAPTAA
jgi:MFS family permease